MSTLPDFSFFGGEKGGLEGGWGVSGREEGVRVGAQHCGGGGEGIEKICARLVCDGEQ